MLIKKIQILEKNEIFNRFTIVFKFFVYKFIRKYQFISINSFEIRDKFTIIIFPFKV